MGSPPRVQYYASVLRFSTTLQYQVSVLRFSTTRQYYASVLRVSTTLQYYASVLCRFKESDATGRPNFRAPACGQLANVPRPYELQ
eukprot:gene788-biopygen8237